MGLLDKLFKEIGSLGGAHHDTTKPEKRFCPVDGTEMELMRIRFTGTNEVIELDRCPKCGGIWFDKGELNKIIRIPVDKMKQIFGEVKEMVSVKGTGSGPRLCPVCGSAMVTYNYDYKSGIWLDACPKGHGIWLDAGELLLLKLYVETRQTFKAKEEVAPKLKKVVNPDRSEREKVLQQEFLEAVKRLEESEESSVGVAESPKPKRREIPFESSSVSTLTPKEELARKPVTSQVERREPVQPPKLEERPKQSTASIPSQPLAQPQPSFASPSTTGLSAGLSATEAPSELEVQVKELGGFWSIRDVLVLPDGRVILVGDGGKVMISEDGESFQQVAELRENLTKATVFHDRLVVVSSYGNLFHAPLTDLSNFTKVSLGYRSLNWVMTVGGSLVVIGSSATIKVTDDLQGFRDVKVDLFADLNAGAYAEGLIVIAGASGAVLMGRSLDDLKKLDLGSTSTFRSVRYINGAFYLVGSSAGLALIRPDGSFDVFKLNVFADLNDVTLHKGKLLIPASSGKLFYGDPSSLKEHRTGSFASYYRCTRRGDEVLIAGDRATLLKVR